MPSEDKISSSIIAGLGIGIVFVALFSVYYAAAFHPKYAKGEVCSSVFGFKHYDKLEIAESLKQPSDVIFLIGTVKKVETKALDWYHPVHRVADRGNYSDLEVIGYEHTGDKIPWKFVTIDVEKYLLDETTNYSDELTFRTGANACFDNGSDRMVSLPTSDLASNRDKSPQFNTGDRSLIEIRSSDDGALDATGVLKLDIDENDMLLPDFRKGIDRPMKLAD